MASHLHNWNTPYDTLLRYNLSEQRERERCSDGQRLVCLRHRFHSSRRSIDCCISICYIQYLGQQDVAHGIKRSLSRLKSLKDVADDSNRRIQELTSKMLEKATPEEVRQKQDIEQIEAEVAAEAENHNGSVSDDDAPSEDDPNSESSDTAKGTSPNGTTQKQAITRHEISEIEAKAIEKVSDMLGLGDIMRDYKLSANDMTLMFDAVSESPLGKYTFIEVGITPASPSFVEMRISRFRQTISMMFEKMQSAGSHVYYVVVFRDNNKSRFLSRIRLRRRNRPITLSNTPYLTILYFNLNEL